MDEIFSKQHYRRTFFVLVALVLALALTARFFVLPSFAPAQSLTGAALLGSLLDNLVVSLFLTVFLGAFVFWLTPAIVKRSAIDVVAPKQINPLLKSAVSTTRAWIYKGACGRYTRATTIPKMAEAARTESIGRDINICLLNPKNDDLCAAYATYRRSLKSGSSGTPWSREAVQEEIIATAVTALMFQFSEPLLRIRVFFVDHFSAFRLDISDQFVVITKEDKEASALRADSGTYFYDSYKDDVRLTERQSKEMVCCGKLVFSNPVDEKKLREAVKCADIFDDSKLSGLDIKRLIDSINKPSDPY
ncbi:hypothetical protein [Hydrocarboniphaga sp.]|uniref:hypothetical protein n=1 Tax=Hydrocarboniphaga sp. TaxID=2033016 RepID=UPI002AB91FB2|nr:hypothetical protein [Hydrocarboniphaga sp.]MDZ4078417.1 hypothetical protein [Hydrocarboniphaga sp.]